MKEFFILVSAGLKLSGCGNYRIYYKLDSTKFLQTSISFALPRSLTFFPANKKKWEGGLTHAFEGLLRGCDSSCVRGFCPAKTCYLIFFKGKIGISLIFRLRPVHGSYVCLVDCIPFNCQFVTKRRNDLNFRWTLGLYGCDTKKRSSKFRRDLGFVDLVLTSLLKICMHAVLTQVDMKNWFFQANRSTKDAGDRNCLKWWPAPYLSTIASPQICSFQDSVISVKCENGGQTDLQRYLIEYDWDARLPL